MGGNESRQDLLLRIRQLEKELDTLKQGENLFHKIFYNSPVPMMITALDTGQIIATNDRFTLVSKFEPNDIRGRTTLGIGFWADAEVREAVVHRLKEAGGIKGMIVEYHTKSSERRLGEISLERIRYRGEDCIITVLYDMTDRETAEAALKARENHFNRILNHANAVIYVKDLQGRYTFVNQAYEDFIGFGTDKVIGRTDYELFPRRVAETLADVDRKVMTSKIPEELEENVPAGGAMRTYWSVKFPLIENNGEVYGLCGISTDIQDRKDVEREREQLIVKLQNALTEIKMLQGIIPICSSCKKIRDDQGYWNQLESYIEQHSHAAFSHGMCPDCAEAFYGKEAWYRKMKKSKK